LVTHTTRIVGVVTKAMGKLKKGDILGIRGPFGNGWGVEKFVGKDIVIVAGGIGLAPLRPAIYQILSNRESYNRVVLLYGRERLRIFFTSVKLKNGNQDLTLRFMSLLIEEQAVGKGMLVL
jgi:NAD(P)H-flavin reductase